MNNSLVKAVIAELLGTFTLVLIGGLAVVIVTTQGGGAGGAGVVLPALAHGLAIVHIAYAYGSLSGAHVNPAVTLGLLVGGNIKLDRAVFYMIAQVVGAIIAAFVINTLIPPPLAEGGSVAGQATGAWTVDNLGAAALLEFILTFFLVTIVYQAAVYGKAGQVAGLAIGLTLAACILAGGPFTGASLNPARTLGPALVAGSVDYVPVYLLATLAGGAVGGFVNAYLLRPDKG